MTEDNSDELEQETKDLLTQVAEESKAFDQEEVTVEELVKRMAEDYLVVLKLRNRALTEPSPSGDSDENLQAELSDEIEQRQEFFKQRIFENL